MINQCGCPTLFLWAFLGRGAEHPTPVEDWVPVSPSSLFLSPVHGGRDRGGAKQVSAGTAPSPGAQLGPASSLGPGGEQPHDGRRRTTTPRDPCPTFPASCFHLLPVGAGSGLCEGSWGAAAALAAAAAEAKGPSRVRHAPRGLLLSRLDSGACCAPARPAGGWSSESSSPPRPAPWWCVRRGRPGRAGQGEAGAAGVGWGSPTSGAGAAPGAGGACPDVRWGWGPCRLLTRRDSHPGGA